MMKQQVRTVPDRVAARFCFLTLFIACSSCISSYNALQAVKNGKPSLFEQIDFEGILKRYLGKDYKPGAPIEGIYEVSCTITKKGKGFLSNVEREKVVGKRENYAKIAIVKDWPDSEREYLEISLNTKNSAHYPIIGEFQSISEGGAFVYKHYVPKESAISYTFTQDLEPEIFEGTRSEVKRSKTITYKLSYLKVYPKRSEVSTRKDP